jgi:3-deoxy-D-manno-octulosonic-acid transferase
MYLFAYNIFLFLFKVGARIAALKSRKAKKWLQGRKNIFLHLSQRIPSNEKIIWFHCASLGEFEQGRPVAEKIRTIYPGYKILITFFSPSGYEERKTYEGAHYIYYLPADSPSNARKFLEIVDPSLVVFVKYEFWYYYFKEISQRHIPFLLISAVFRPGQPFFKWYGPLYRKMLSCFSYIFVQDNASMELLASLGLTGIASIAGDTRFDRVTEIAEKFENIPAIENFCDNHKVIVAGSTWGDDEKKLAMINDPSLKLIIAPHEINNDHIAALKTIFPSSILYSELNTHYSSLITHYSSLIIDSIGLLSRLYKYADITYVGGGFTRDGIHNILEAAVFGKPVLFGPNFRKYREAGELIEAGGAISISNEEELKQTLYTLLNDGKLYNDTCLASGNFITRNAGATKKILQYIQEKRLLTS